MENVETVVAVVSAVLALATYIANSIKKFRDMNKKELIELACKVIEEGVVTAELHMADAKHEAALQAGVDIRKGPAEIVKNPIETNRVIQAALKPVRKQAHEMAASYISDIVVKNKKLSKILSPETISQAISLAIKAPKTGGFSPLISLFARKA